MELRRPTASFERLSLRATFSPTVHHGEKTTRLPTRVVVWNASAALPSGARTPPWAVVTERSHRRPCYLRTFQWPLCTLVAGLLRVLTPGISALSNLTLVGKSLPHWRADSCASSSRYTNTETMTSLLTSWTAERAEKVDLHPCHQKMAYPPSLPRLDTRNRALPQ